MAYIAEWFKVIKDGQLIGVVTDQSFARYSEKSGRVLICKAIDGQYIVVNDHFYRCDWMLPLNPEDHTEYEEATVISITEKEYDILVGGGEEEPIDSKLIDKTPPPPERAPKMEDIATVEYVRKLKLDALSKECENAIIGGFDLELTDGIAHHFSMSLQDQLNLLSLQQSFIAGTDTIYHADGELEQFYSSEDTLMILSGAQRWKSYNIALYNSLKNWVNHINNIEAIDAVKYDSEIPEEYCTTVLQTLAENF